MKKHVFKTSKNRLNQLINQKFSIFSCTIIMILLIVPIVLLWSGNVQVIQKPLRQCSIL
ncbi:MAG: hypothetical protein LVQ75_03935 [Candidatus Babeliales bacterium]|jgi:hypothetical protein